MKASDMMHALLTRRSLAACTGILVAGIGGCTKTAGSTVTGMVTIDGRPAPAGIRIDFDPQVEKASSSTGYTDANGRYEMRFNVHRLGVMPGESLVRLFILPPIGLTIEPVIPASLRAIRLPESVSTRTTLRKTVKPGVNTIDIAIETKPAK